MSDLLKELSKPFHPSQVSWKPGTIKGDRAMAMPYADLRAYMNRLDEVCGLDWSIEYRPWGEERIIACLTINGVTRSSTGEMAAQDEKNEIGGTVAEAQAMKRACAQFGLGRYLYQLPTGWADIDPQTKRFTDKAKAKLTGILVQHYRRATGGHASLEEIYQDAPVANTDAPEAMPAQNVEGDVLFDKQAPQEDIDGLLKEFNKLGLELYGDTWEQVCRRNVKRISGGTKTFVDELSAEQVQRLVEGMWKLQEKKQAQQQAEPVK